MCNTSFDGTVIRMFDAFMAEIPADTRGNKPSLSAWNDSQSHPAVLELIRKAIASCPIQSDAR